MGNVMQGLCDCLVARLVSQARLSETLFLSPAYYVAFMRTIKLAQIMESRISGENLYSAHSEKPLRAFFFSIQISPLPLLESMKRYCPHPPEKTKKTQRKQNK